MLVSSSGAGSKLAACVPGPARGGSTYATPAGENRPSAHSPRTTSSCAVSGTMSLTVAWATDAAAMDAAPAARAGSRRLRVGGVGGVGGGGGGGHAARRASACAGAGRAA